MQPCNRHCAEPVRRCADLPRRLWSRGWAAPGFSAVPPHLLRASESPERASEPAGSCRVCAQPRRARLRRVGRVAQLTAALVAQCVDQLRSKACPNCREPLPSVASFPVNIALLGIVDAMCPVADDEDLFLCDHQGQKQVKDLFCLDCGRVCCSACVIFGAHRQHTVERAARLGRGVVRTINLEALAVLEEMYAFETCLKVLSSPSVCCALPLRASTPERSHVLTQRALRLRAPLCRLFPLRGSGDGSGRRGALLRHQRRH
jgi:hypothetical protein